MFRRFSLSDPTQQYVGLSVHQKIRPEVNSVLDETRSRSLSTSPTPLQKKKKDLDVVYANSKGSRVKKISLPELSNSLGGHFGAQSRRNSAIIRRNYGEFYKARVSRVVSIVLSHLIDSVDMRYIGIC